MRNKVNSRESPGGLKVAMVQPVLGWKAAEGPGDV